MAVNIIDKLQFLSFILVIIYAFLYCHEIMTLETMRLENWS